MLILALRMRVVIPAGNRQATSAPVSTSAQHQVAVMDTSDKTQPLWNQTLVNGVQSDLISMLVGSMQHQYTCMKLESYHT